MTNEDKTAYMATLLGSKTLANTAISYLSRCRDVPTPAQVAEHLKVPARTAGKIVAAAKMSQCFLMDTMPLKLANSNVVGWYLADLKAEPTEVLIVLTLGPDNSLIARHQCAMGPLSNVVVDEAAVYRYALADGAKGIIVAHNHPSGVLEFSQPDVDFTKKLIAAGKMLHIAVLDSILVTRRGVMSMRKVKEDIFIQNGK